MKNLIWQPSITNRYDFLVSLDFDFAREMIRAQIPSESQKRLNELANEELKQMGVNWSNPYTFYEKSCFVSQIYIGNNGVWLATNHSEIERLARLGENNPIKYYSHNVDTAREAYILMALFDKWVDLSDVLKGD